MRLPTRLTSPLGTCHTVPSWPRSTVVRRLTRSTGPLATPRSTTSPMPYWSSISMNSPVMQSLTRFWAPKPMATPAIPAPAISGARSSPS